MHRIAGVEGNESLVPGDNDRARLEAEVGPDNARTVEACTLRAKQRPPYAILMEVGPFHQRIAIWQEPAPG